MFIVYIENLLNKKEIKKVFWNRDNMIKFVRKVNYSKKVRLLCVEDNSLLYD